MPNWAELHEISSSLKATHAEVHYTAHSKMEVAECGNCENFIPVLPGRSRCRTVECPIAEGGWCERYKKL